MKNCLTAIIPVGNVKGHLFSLEQTLMECNEYNVEVVIVHDNFNDGTSESLRALRYKFANLAILEGNFRSPGAARNLGMEHISTQWFCFWDVDDLPRVVAYSDAASNDVAKHFSVIIGHFSIMNFETGRTRSWNLPSQGDRKFAEIAINPGIWRFVFQTQKYRNVRFGLGSMGEDQLFLARLDLSQDDIMVIQEDFYRYSENLNGQLTQTSSRILELESVIREESMLRKAFENSSFIDHLIVKQSITLIAYRKSELFKVIRPLLISLLNLKFAFFRFVYDIFRSSN
jgi:glycosyltransferase involved in cell wall biosynthesis